MHKRRPNYRLVKIHRNYTVEEAARLFDAHKNTVRAWVKAGLPTCDNKRPTLILGCDLAEYLRARRTKNKRPCKPGEIYCVRCRAPKQPAGEMAEYQPITASLGNLIGICPDYDAMMYRRATRVTLPEIRGRLDIAFSETEQRLREIDSPIVNTPGSTPSRRSTFIVPRWMEEGKKVIVFSRLYLMAGCSWMLLDK